MSETDPDVTPRPDPTVLTTRQLIREVESVREICGKDKEIIETRLLGNDRAIELLEKEKDRIPELISNAFRQLKELHAEKFASIDKQFLERDARNEQSAKGAQVAIDAAFRSAGEAVGKTEASFTKQIDQQREVIQQMTKTTDEKINDLKDRLNLFEGRRTGMSDGWGYVAAALGLLVAAAAVAVAFIK